jgi:hypothetical protein
MRIDPTAPAKKPAAVKSGFHTGPSKRGKAPQETVFNTNDFIGGPQPVPYPGAHPHPAAPPMPPHPMPAPAPARATGGRVAPGGYPDAGPTGGSGGAGAMPAAMNYAPPGMQNHVLALLARALAPDTF